METASIEIKLIQSIKNDLIKENFYEMAAQVREIERNETISWKERFELIYSMVQNHQFEMDQRQNQVGDVIELDPETSALYMEAFELASKLRSEAEALLVKASEYNDAAALHVVNKNPELKKFKFGISNDGTKAMILGYHKN